jgi:cysteine desulfurase
MTYYKGYFDYNATTPMSRGVIKQLQKAFNLYANPSSSSMQGQDCKNRINLARKHVADLIGAKTEEIIFTSGGSESNNFAVKSQLLKSMHEPGNIIVSTIEHSSILSIINYFEKEFGLSVNKINPNKKGFIEPNTILRALTPDTKLITVMMANNETGNIQPIKEIGEIAHSKKIFFHVDGIQAVGKIPVDVGQIKVDTLSISAHKFYGPKGVGALYMRNLNNSHPLVHGGGQEKGIRGGTENVMGIIGMGQAALEAKASLTKWQAHFTQLRGAFIEQLSERIPDAKLNGPETERDCLLNTLNVYLPNIRAEALSALLEHKHHCVISLGAACSNHKTLNLSHVLTAIGLPEKRIKGSIRISFGQYTSLDDVRKLVDAIHQSYQMLISVAG